jgi:hypothetical protein
MAKILRPAKLVISKNGHGHILLSNGETSIGFVDQTTALEIIQEFLSNKKICIEEFELMVEELRTSDLPWFICMFTTYEGSADREKRLYHENAHLN